MNSNNDSIKGLLKDKTKEIYDKTEKIVNNTPTPIKVLTAILSFILTIFFTYYKFDFFMSVSLALITLLTLASINRIIAIAFGFIYAYSMYQLITKRDKMIGKVVQSTDILYNKAPYVGFKTSEVIQASTLEEGTMSNNFSYQFWMYINGMQIDANENYKVSWDNYRYGQWKSVFYRGNALSTDIQEVKTQLDTMLQYPGVWLAPKLNNLSIVFKNNDENQPMERIEIEDVPMNEWFCVTILVEGYSVSIYINGLLVNSMLLNQIQPGDLNTKNIYIGKDELLNQCQNCTAGTTKGGWPGFLAELIYYPYVLSNEEISDSYKYYKKIVDQYQSKINNEKKSKYPALISKKDIVNLDFLDKDKINTITENNNKDSIFRY